MSLSVSGNSPNCVKAIEWAKANGLTVLALTGGKNNRMAELADKVIQIDSSHYGRVEDTQMMVAHLICYAFMEKADLLNTLIASRNQLTSALLDALNEKVEKVSDELEHLLAKRDIMSKDLPPEDAFYTEAIETLRKLRRVSDDLLTANDPFALRQVLLAGIERIQLTAEGDFQIYGSSSNCNEWYTGWESNPHSEEPEPKSGASANSATRAAYKI